MRYVLGVDGGNTKTIVLVARLDGRIVAAERDGPGDIYAAPSPETVLAGVERAVVSALDAAGCRREDLAAGAFSMAGADWPEDFDLLRSAMSEHRFGSRVIVVNDALGALRAGSPDGTGVAVVCGTGAATGARAADGRTWHSSWWQEPQGGRDLALKTLWAVYRAELGLDPPTALTARVLAFFGQRRVEEVLHLFTARGVSRPTELGGLTRLLLDEAGAGDPTARRIVQEHGAALGDYALAAARQVGIEDGPFALVLSGGVLRHACPLLAEAIIGRVREAAPGARPIRSRFEPAVGALLLALEAAGVALEEPLLGRLAATLPPSSLFET